MTSIYLKITNFFFVGVLGLLTLSSVAQSQEVLTGENREEANKKAALEFYQALVGDVDIDKAEPYAGEYIQHDPDICCDGFPALKQFLIDSPTFLKRDKIQIRFHNVMADGDLVYFQTRRTEDLPTGEKERVLVQHSFRFDSEGKIAEHWVTNSRVKLTETENPHPFF